MKPSFSSDIEIAPHEQASAVNFKIFDFVPKTPSEKFYQTVHVGVLFIERRCPQHIKLGGVTVILPPESANLRNPHVLTEIDLEVYIP